MKDTRRDREKETENKKLLNFNKKRTDAYLKQL